MLDCVSERIPISLRKVTVPLYLPPVRPTPVCRVQFKAPQYKTDVNLLEPVQQGHQDGQGLEHRAHTRRGGWSWDCSAWGRGSARGFSSVSEPTNGRLQRRWKQAHLRGTGWQDKRQHLWDTTQVTLIRTRKSFFFFSLAIRLVRPWNEGPRV